MITTTLSDFRRNIKKYLDNVINNFETLIINRGKGTGVVIMSIDEYNSLTDTQHELSSKVNEQKMDSAISKFKTGNFIKWQRFRPALPPTPKGDSAHTDVSEEIDQ